MLKWCRYLPKNGVEVHVLAPDDPKWIDAGGGLEVPAGTVVHRTKNLSPTSVRPTDAVAAARGPVRRVLRKIALQPRRMLVPDMHVGWSVTAVRRGIDVVRAQGIEAVISTSPPETTHLIAARIARACDVPWIADFRDSWLDLPHLRTDRASVRYKHAVNTRMATRIMSRSAAITTVSEPLANDLRNRHPGIPVHVITNGIDMQDCENLPGPPPLAGGRAREDVCVIAYTGNFFGRQSPQSFLRALSDMLDRRPELIDRVVVRFVGGLTAADHAFIDRSAVLQHVIERIPFMDYRDVLAEQRAADILLLYVAPGPNSQGVYTGKVFEYVAAERPVLALVPHDNVCVELLHQAGLGICVPPDDHASITRMLETEVDRRLGEGRIEYRVPAHVLAAISREAQAEQVAHLLRTVVHPTTNEGPGEPSPS